MAAGGLPAVHEEDVELAALGELRAQGFDLRNASELGPPHLARNARPFWLAVRQLTIIGASNKHIRPDLLLFLSGLPVVATELKDPTDEGAPG